MTCSDPTLETIADALCVQPIWDDANVQRKAVKLLRDLAAAKPAAFLCVDPLTMEVFARAADAGEWTKLKADVRILRNGVPVYLKQEQA